MSSHYEKRAKDGSSMSLTSLIHSLAILSSKMTVEPSRKMHELLYILVLMEMPGGMQNKYLSKFARSLRSLRPLILESKHYLSLASLQPMLHSHPMH